MTWTRFDLKERGKAAFQRNYWRSVLVAFILMLFVSGGGSAGGNLSGAYASGRCEGTLWPGGHAGLPAKRVWPDGA